MRVEQPFQPDYAGLIDCILDDLENMDAIQSSTVLPEGEITMRRVELRKSFESILYLIGKDYGSHPWRPDDIQELEDVMKECYRKFPIQKIHTLKHC